MKREAEKIRDAKQKRARRCDDPAVLHNDRLDAQAIDAAVAEIVVQMGRCLERDPGRGIRALGRQELRHIAIGCISAYIVCRSRQRVLEQLDDLLTVDEKSVLQ